MLIYHMALVLSGIACIAAGAAIARFMRKKTWWLKAHRACAAAGAVIVTAGIAVAFLMVQMRSGMHMNIPHAYLGVIILSLVITAPTLGFLAFRIRRHAAQLRTAHRWLGRLTLMLLIINAVSGFIITGIIG